MKATLALSGHIAMSLDLEVFLGFIVLFDQKTLQFQQFPTIS